MSASLTAVEAERRLTSQGIERKQQLLDCAAELFAERGYADTRVIDICKAAGVAKGLFYWYFENKEALFREVTESIRHQLRRHQAKAMDPDADPLARICQGTAASVQFMSQHARFFALLEAERADRHMAQVLRSGSNVYVSDVRRLVDEGQAQGLIRDDDPTLLALGVVAMVGMYSHYHRTGRLDVPVDELAPFVARFLARSLAADEEIARRTELRHPTPSATGTGIGTGTRGDASRTLGAT